MRAAVAARIRKIRRRDFILWGSLLVALGGALIVFALSGHFSLTAIAEAISGLNPVLVIGLMAILPLAGFSISVVYLVVGARFGPIAGLPVVIGVTAFHLLATYWLTRSFLRGPLERFLARRGHHLPAVLPGEHAEICVLGTLVPGIPYFARNYLLALTDAPLKTYFWVCLAVHVTRSYVAIMVGDLAGNPNRTQLLVLAAVYAVKLSLCAFIVWRLRIHRHSKPSSAK
ncbi:MAG: associated Golgi protein [Verrucomicrobia bacterium]|nr:associated Golgi protein [Verrucomicrobiota bacterium]